MRKSVLILSLGIVSLAPFSFATSASQSASATMQRIFPSVAKHFHFSLLPAKSKPSYFYRAAHGEVYVGGTSGVAMCRGAYDYLRAKVGAEATWGGTTLASSKLADAPLTLKDCPYQIVLQDNVCVFGYTTAFFGWKQWERYLDVMALHGINMQFAPVGGEAIWDKVWTKFGISRKDINNFFTGPAFLPWHRMGNVNKHDGPLPKSYQRESVALEKKILRRMRELGIQPVAPAFAGFVPPGFAKRYPKEKVLRVDSWAGFQDDYRTQILHPLSPMYAKIGGAYVKAWRNEFGDAKYYLADSFNELTVPVSADRAQRLKELSGFGKAVYDGIKAGDPSGTWVMQGWLFFNEAGFWDTESVAALLKPVPNNKMLILDLFAEASPIWKKQHAFYGKQWIVSNITTWGGNNQAYGNFDLYRKLSADTLAGAHHGNLVGYGISFEGSESNEVQFELLCDTAWDSKPISMAQYLPSLVRNRYGAADAYALKAWKEFGQSIYAMRTGIHPNHLLQSRPYDLSPTSHGAVNDSDLFRQGVRDLLKAKGHLGANPLYHADVVQLSAQLILLEADKDLRDAVLATDDGATSIADQYIALFADLTKDADRLLASHPLDRLQRWVENARAWGIGTADQNYYEADARRQVTVWGGPELSEYAAKMWSGLMWDYYAHRWISWIQAKKAGTKWDPSHFEEHWITRPSNRWPVPYGHPLNEAKTIVDSILDSPMGHYASQLQGVEVGTWKTGEQSTTYQLRTWTLPDAVSQAGTLIVHFQYTDGACRLDIDGVELLVDGQVVSTDHHFGRTGLEDVGNTFRLKLSQVAAGAKVELRAKVRSDGGNDSNGTIYVRVR